MAGLAIWKREKDGESALDRLGLRVGSYELDFDTTLLPRAFLPEPKKWQGKHIAVGGKEARIDSIKFFETPEGHKTIVGVSIIKNLFPLLILLGALGIIATLFLREVRLVFEKSPVMGAALVGIVGFTLYGIAKAKRP